MRSLAVAGLALALVGAGCWVSSPPIGPYGHATLDGAKLAPLVVPPLRRVTSTRLVVVGRFDDVATQPVGGMYDRVEWGVTPLYRTYYYADAPLELFEHVTDALRAAGIDARKDYASRAEPSLVEAPLRVLDPVLVGATLVSLQHDQAREAGEPPREQELVRVVVRVDVRDLAGRALYAREHLIEGRAPLVAGGDVLRAVGLALGARLVADDAFVAAIGAKGAT